MVKGSFNHKRVNPSTGKIDYFFPMEIKSKSDRDAAKAQGLEIAWTRLGYRTFEAVMVPCKNVVRDANGNETYIDTPSEVQRELYLSYICDELAEQEAIKQDGRCFIPDGHGGTKRCPCRITNPNYIPGGDAPKTLPVKCEGCMYEEFKTNHTVITFSALANEVAETGKVIPFDVPAPNQSFEAARYIRMSRELIAAVIAEAPDLADFARLLLQESTRSEAARELGMHISTAAYRRKKIMEIADKFLDSTITF